MGTMECGFRRPFPHICRPEPSPLRIDILTALPRLLDSWFNESILERAQKKGLVEKKESKKAK